MSNIEKYQPNNLIELAKKIEVENDFGQKIMGLGLLSQDKGVIAVGSLLGVFLGCSVVGVPLGIIVGIMGINDWIAIDRQPQDQITPEPDTGEDYQNEGEPSYVPERSPYTASLNSLNEPTGSTFASTQDTRSPIPFQTEVVEFKAETPNLAQKLANDMKNTLIVGVPGSGKGLLVSNALRYVCDRGDATVFYVDPKNDTKETGYFQGRVHYLFRLNGGILKADALDVYDWLKKCLQAFHEYDAGNGRKLLVLDEITALVRKLANVPAKMTGTVKGDKWLEEEIVTCAAAGDSVGATIWGMAQNGHNSGLGLDGGAKSQMVPIAIISRQQLAASQALLKAQFVPSDKRLNSSEIKQICEESEVGRAIFHGGLNQWYPLPVMPNLSGFDRDSRQQVGAIVSEDDLTAIALNETSLEVFENSKNNGADSLANIIEGLRNTHHNTLWEYFTEETGASPDEARTAIGYIAEVIFDSGLSSLQSKFRLRSKWDARYSYKGCREKSARAHRFTDGICCCCREKSSAQAHHTEYLGAEDEPGINLYPVCKPCHDSICHNSTNWVRGGIWEAHSTEQFTQKLQEGFRQLAS